jgi:hypothetical protein
MKFVADHAAFAVTSNESLQAPWADWHETQRPAFARVAAECRRRLISAIVVADAGQDARFIADPERTVTIGIGNASDGRRAVPA